MKHLTALAIKYVFIAAALFLVLSGRMGMDSGSLLWTAAVLTLALYLLGDLLILPNFGNVTATVADAGVALLLTWLAPTYAGVRMVPFMSALYVAILIGVAEYFFHPYLQRSIIPGPAMGDGEGNTGG